MANMDECVFAGPLSRLVLVLVLVLIPAANASGKSLLNNFESASLPAACSLMVYTLYAICHMYLHSPARNALHWLSSSPAPPLSPNF